MDVETILLQRNGWIPNNEHLPVLVYRSAIDLGSAEEFCRERLRKNDWGNTWVNGVYDFHHYHSVTHEFLGVLAGSATLMLGGEGGRKLEVAAGDALVLPAGTGHKRLSASDDFSVLGAYPGGRDYDMRYGREDEWPEVLRNIADVPVPGADPLFGHQGPLGERWR